jgi:preprotein translocase subunit YajC
MVCSVFLAQNGGAPPVQPKPFGGLLMLAPVFLIMIVFMWMSSRSQKKKEQARQAMLDNVKAKDRVVTVGGIHGRVVSAKGNRLVLCVDENKDVRVSVNRSGIARVVTGDGDEEQDEASA